RDHGDEGRLSAAARPDQEAQLSEASVEVDAAQGLDPRLSLPEVLPPPAARGMRVVFPQPLGPTRKLSSPKPASKSMPRRASTRASPSPKYFLTPRPGG